MVATSSRKRVAFLTRAWLSTRNCHRFLATRSSSTIFLLRDCALLTGSGRNVFASPLREIRLTCRRPGNGPKSWTVADDPPRFRRIPRRRPFHGWMLGIRCAVSSLSGPIDQVGSALAAMSATFTRAIDSSAPSDELIRALDACIDELMPLSADPRARSAFRPMRVLGGDPWPKRCRAGR
jgi:hypothetical protein